MYIKVKAKISELLENGLQKKTSKVFLIGAYSFTEAEAKATEKLKEYYNDFEITDMGMSPYNEVMLDTDGEYWIGITIKVQHVNDKGKVNYEKIKFLLEGDNTEHATDNFKESMKHSMLDYSIAKVEVTNIEDVFEMDKTIGEFKDEE